MAQPDIRLTEKHKTHIYSRNERYLIKCVQFKISKLYANENILSDSAIAGA